MESAVQTAEAGTLDVAPLQRWRRLFPSWIRSRIWTDSADGFDAFLSYSWKADKLIAPIIQSVLQRFLCPWYKARARTIFRDLSSLPAASSLKHELFSRLDRSAHLIVLASPEAATSRGMELEARYWFGRERAGQVIIIVTAGSPASDSEVAEWNVVRDQLLPPAFRDYLADSEPIWIPLHHRRAEMLREPRGERVRGLLIEDLKQVFLQLYPGATWEELHGEERSQKRRAMALMSGAVALLLAAGAGVVWQWVNAVSARSEAEVARNEAQLNYRSAVQVATETGKLVKDELLPDGAKQSKSVVARNLLEVSANTFENINPKYEDAAAAFARTQLLELIWNNYYILHDFAAATKAAELELRIAAEHVNGSGRGSPSRADWLRFWVRADQNLGDDARQQASADSLRKAEGYFRDGLRQAQLLAADPDARSWPDELAHAHERVGDVLRDERSFALALAEYQTSLELASTADEVPRQRALAVLHGKIGDMLVTQEDFAGAEREFRADLSMALALFKRYPESADIHRGLAVAHERLGYALGRERHWSEARQEYQAELDILTPLVAGDPGDFQWRMDRALSEEGLGDVALGESRAETAIARYRDYAGIMTEAMKDFTPDDRMRRYLAIAYQRLGDALLRIGRSDEGRGYLEQCAAVGALAGGYDARNAEPGDVTGYCRAALARSAR